MNIPLARLSRLTLVSALLLAGMQGAHAQTVVNGTTFTLRTRARIAQP